MDFIDRKYLDSDIESSDKDMDEESNENSDSELQYMSNMDSESETESETDINLESNGENDSDSESNEDTMSEDDDLKGGTSIGEGTYKSAIDQLYNRNIYKDISEINTAKEPNIYHFNLVSEGPPRLIEVTKKIDMYYRDIIKVDIEKINDYINIKENDYTIEDVLKGTEDKELNKIISDSEYFLFGRQTHIKDKIKDKVDKITVFDKIKNVVDTHFGEIKSKQNYYYLRELYQVTHFGFEPTNTRANQPQFNKCRLYNAENKGYFIQYLFLCFDYFKTDKRSNNEYLNKIIHIILDSVINLYRFNETINERSDNNLDKNAYLCNYKDVNQTQKKNPKSFFICKALLKQLKELKDIPDFNQSIHIKFKYIYIIIIYIRNTTNMATKYSNDYYDNNYHLSNVNMIVDKCCKYNVIMYMKGISHGLSKIMSFPKSSYGSNPYCLPYINNSLYTLLTKSPIGGLFTDRQSDSYFFKDTKSPHAVVYQLRMLFTIYNYLFLKDLKYFSNTNVVTQKIDPTKKVSSNVEPNKKINIKDFIPVFLFKENNTDSNFLLKKIVDKDDKINIQQNIDTDFLETMDKSQLFLVRKNTTTPSTTMPPVHLPLTGALPPEQPQQLQQEDDDKSLVAGYLSSVIETNTNN